MRVIFFGEIPGPEPEKLDEIHLFSIAEMDVPCMGDVVWINHPGLRSEARLPANFHGHNECEVIRRSLSIMVTSTGSEEPLYTSAHAEILLRVKP